MAAISKLLVVTHSEDVTADYLCTRLAAGGVELIRFNTDCFIDTWNIEVADLCSELIFDGQRISPEQIGAIWLRRPKPLAINGIADEAERLHIQGEWSEALEGFLAHIPLSRWVNHPSSNVGASHKIEQLSRAQRYGIAVPRTLVTTNSAILENFWNTCKGQVILKPLCSGYIERNSEEFNSSIYTNRLPHEALTSASLASCPTLFQEAVPKGIDVRVTVIDSHVHAVGIAAPSTDSHRLDIRRGNMSDVIYSELNLPPPLKERLMNYLRSYHLRFAAVDFIRKENGDWIFLEVNPNGQWAWLDIAGASDIAKSFITVFKNET